MYSLKLSAKTRIYRFCTCLLLFFCLLTQHAAADGKRIIGAVENVRLNGLFVAKAKIDTGARHSSVNAPDYQFISKDNQQWVKFTLLDEKGNRYPLEKKVTRIASIKRKGQEPKQRPVISFGICLAGVYQELDVNLANRENFNYPVLIGRSFLSGHFLVDSELSFTTKPQCDHNS